MSPLLILGSTSPYRRELLGRLHLPFEVHAPEVDETPLNAESPVLLVQRLALAKAQAVARLHPHAVVIGADQVADLNGQPVGKPGGHDQAALQLRSLSGRRVPFYTAVAVVRTSTGHVGAALSTVQVQFRDLSAVDIENYLLIEQPYDCAGSAKAESLGIALLEAIESDDPTALMGLPLIRTCALLRAAGLDPLAGAA